MPVRVVLRAILYCALVGRKGKGIAGSGRNGVTMDIVRKTLRLELGLQKLEPGGC